MISNTNGCPEPGDHFRMPCARSAWARWRVRAAMSSSSSTASAPLVHTSLWNGPGARPSSMPPLGSIPKTFTCPARIAGARARSTAHITEDLPASLTPATRTCRSRSRSSHDRPVSVRPITTRARSTSVPGSGRQGTVRGLARGSAWMRSSQIRRGRSTRTRQERAPKELASSSATAA